MSEQPPTAADPVDPDSETDSDDELDDPWHDQIVEVADEFGAPDILAVVAFALAICSFFGYALLSGSTYTLPFAVALGNNDNKGVIVTGSVLGAVLALIPAWLGWRASSRSLDTDPRWVAVLARSAIILALGSGLLHLVVAVLQAAQEGSAGFSRI